MNAFAEPRYPYEPMYREAYNLQPVSPADHIQFLKDYIRIAEYLTPSQDRLTIPTLRHPDLLPSNIFVSDKLNVVGIIDWQHASVLPLFLHAGIPDPFQNYGDPVSEDGEKPQLPADFDQLDHDAQQEAKQKYARQLMHTSYSYATESINPLHYEACTVPQIAVRQKLFRHASNPWEGNSATLRADLVVLYQNWTELTSSSKKQSPCPLLYSEEDCAEWSRRSEVQQKADDTMAGMRDILGVNMDGWTSNENYGFARAMSDKMKASCLELAETELERTEVIDHWPFDAKRQEM